jgi:hypothetical protein
MPNLWCSAHTAPVCTRYSGRAGCDRGHRLLTESTVLGGRPPTFVLLLTAWGERTGQPVDRARATEAVEEAASGLDTTNASDEFRIAAAPAEAHIIPGKPNEWCPAPQPCIGRPAVRIAVPVRVVDPGTSGRQVGELVGEVPGTYCPLCRSMKADAAA